MRLLPAALATVAAAAVLAGCSGQQSNDAASDYRGEQKRVAQVIDDLSKAGRDRDTKQICTSILAEPVVRKLRQGAKDCQDALSEQLKDADDFGLDVKSIQIQGDRATAKVVGPVNGDDREETMTFVRQGQAWRLAGLTVPGA